MVQRLSSVPSGRLKKYQPIEAREFVPFIFHEYTLENVKASCQKHYGKPPGSCDVLASNRGPSCSQIQQSQSKKVFFVRFLDAGNAMPPPPSERILAGARPNCPMSSHDIGATNDANNTISEYQPPSILQLLKAGQLIENVANAVELDLNSFDLTTSSWAMAEKRATFNISRIQFAHGSFRDAHKATVIQGAETVKYWVDKVYRDEIAATIENDMGPTIDQHTRKQVQLHEIARFLCAQFAASAPASIGATFSLNRIFHSTYNQKPETLEPYSEGKFIKFVNNNGKINRQLPDNLIVQQQKVDALVHFNYEYTHKKLMLLDVQGSAEQMKLYDPEIATKKLMSGDDKIFLCAGNFKHGCN